jgi:molybdenum cofactor guanylyltransferase
MATSEQTPGLTVAIQAGGKSTRMGVDKSFVLFEGRPMIEIVKNQVSRLGEETILISNNSGPYAYLDLPIFPDIYPDTGPLGGIFTALKAARYEHVLVVACDMPWLNLPLLQHLISLKDSADVVVPRWNKFPEPLHALYNKRCIAPIEERLKANQLKITGFFAEVKVRFVDQEDIARFDPQGLSFTNVNTPEDLQ